MTRSLLLTVIVLTTLAMASSARASGSSTVMFTTKHFQLRLETPRMIFRRSADEQRWHLEARQRLKREGAALREKLLVVIAKLARTTKWLRLGRFKFDLPRVQQVNGKLVATKQTPQGTVEVPTKGKGPYNLELPLPSAAAAMVTLTLTVKQIPRAKRRSWLTRKLQDAARAKPRP